MLGGAYRDGNGGLPRPPNFPGCLGKRSKHHHFSPKTIATGVFLFFALLEVIKQVFTYTNDYKDTQGRMQDLGEGGGFYVNY